MIRISSLQISAKVFSWGMLLGFGWIAPVSALADEWKSAEKAVWKLAKPLEQNDNFVFRAEPWVNEITPQVGKAVKVQLFKGNEYRFCLAVPPDSGVTIDAAVLDFDGKPGGKILPLEAGWGLIVEYEPQKTGVYVIAVRHVKGAERGVPCAMITGYR